MEDILAPAMDAAKLELLKYDVTKKRCVILKFPAEPMTMDKFCKTLRDHLGEDYESFPTVFKAAHDPKKLSPLVMSHAEALGVVHGRKELPPSFTGYQLNLNLESDPPKFFVTTKEEYMSAMSGAAFVSVLGFKHEEAVGVARHVFMEYDPRGGRGVRTVKNGRESRSVFNTYVPPLWRGHPDVKKVNPKIHPLFQKCIKHVFPIKTERRFFYAWLYASLFKRAPTYLILCGNAGLGKNRIKLLLRALHGHENTPDGKKSSLTERFNSQVERTTLLWFDELLFNEDIENILKEMQNETISIEKKGIDASRSTKIYSSMVISNNYPRNNYIQFDSRKFVPLELGTTKLGTSMTNKEIDRLTKMTSFPDTPEFDVSALAEFVAWLKRYGPRFAVKFPNLEYKGPMFYRLAHTTMSRWQIAVIQFLLSDKLKSAYISDKPELGVRWSTLEPAIRKTLYKGYSWPHPETIRRFLEIYCSLKGEQGFKVTTLRDGVNSDFYLKPLLKKVPNVEALAEGRSIDEEESDLDLL